MPLNALEQAPTLDQCLDIAFANNLDMAQGRKNRNAAEDETWTADTQNTP